MPHEPNRATPSLPFGASRAEPVTTRNGEDRGARKLLIAGQRFVWRPQGSSNIYCRAAIPAGTGEAREYVAYLFDRELGFGLVPETEWREWRGTRGSRRRWIGGDFRIWHKIDENDECSVCPTLEEVGWPMLAKLWVLQAVLLNIDCTRENLLWSPSRRQVYVLDLRECLAQPGTLAALGGQFNPGFPWWRKRIQHWQLPSQATDPVRCVSWDSLREAAERVGVAPACIDAATRRATAILRRPIADIGSLITITDPGVPALMATR